MQNAECKIIFILYRHSEGVKRLWESPLLLLKLKVGDCHEPNGSRNDALIYLPQN
jgi:hypothetical protein